MIRFKNITDLEQILIDNGIDISDKDINDVALSIAKFVLQKELRLIGKEDES